VVSDAGSTVKREHFPLLGPYVRPQTPTETIIEDIWRRAFTMDMVGIADSYEDLGGDSLIAVGILSDIEAAFQTEIPLGLLDDTSTIGHLAAEIDSLRRKKKIK
jgi:surfactin family lipopeptide synthetase A